MQKGKREGLMFWLWFLVSARAGVGACEGRYGMVWNVVFVCSEKDERERCHNRIKYANLTTSGSDIWIGLKGIRFVFIFRRRGLPLLLNKAR